MLCANVHSYDSFRVNWRAFTQGRGPARHSKDNGNSQNIIIHQCIASRDCERGSWTYCCDANPASRWRSVAAIINIRVGAEMSQFKWAPLGSTQADEVKCYQVWTTAYLIYSETLVAIQLLSSALVLSWALTTSSKNAFVHRKVVKHFRLPIWINNMHIKLGSCDSIGVSHPTFGYINGLQKWCMC